MGFGPGDGAPGTPGVPAEFGSRVVAYLIDFAVVFVAFIAVLIIGAIVGVISDVLGGLLVLLGYLAAIVYSFWNLAYLQGTTGQSIGKRSQGIRLEMEATRAPVGFGMAFLRYIVASAISSITCGLYGVIDLLWPLWDNKRQRLTDKMLKMQVVTGDGPRNLGPESFNPFAKR